MPRILLYEMCIRDSTRQAKRDFAAVGRAWFFYFAVSLVAAFLASFLAEIVGGTWLESDWGLYMVGLVIPYRCV